MEDFKRKVRPGNSADINIEYRKGVLSLSGWFRGSSGQIYDRLKDITKFNKGYDKDVVRKLVKVWKRWHLNNMRSGCEHQREAGWGEDTLNWFEYSLTATDHKIELPAYVPITMSYTSKIISKQRYSGIIYPHEHPKGVLEVPCPICGHRYGSEFLFEPVPDDVLVWLKKLP